MFDEIGEFGFGKVDSDVKFRDYVLFEFVRCGVDIVKVFRVMFWGVGVGGWLEGWCFVVDGLSKVEDGVGVDIIGKVKNCVIVDISVFKVDVGIVVFVDDDL